MTAASAPGGAASPTLVESSHHLPLVSISVGTRAGAALDPAERAGLTRLTARLMRRTAGGRDPQELDTRIDAIGASLGVEVSASTVVFHGAVIERSLDAFAEILEEALARPGLSEDEIGRLVRETEAELRETLDDDRTLARRWFRHGLFRGHAYGQPISGTSGTLHKLDRAAIVERARGIATRGGLVFALAGDVARARAETLAARIRAALPDGSPIEDRLPEPEPTPGRRLLLVDKPERTQTQILIGGLGTHPLDPDHTALLVGNTIFGGTFTARLTQEVRSKRGWSYGAYSQLPIDRRRAAFSLWTFPKAEDAAPCIKLELDMLEALIESGVTKKELSWAKRYLVRSHAFAVDTAAKRVGMALDQILYELPPGYYADYLERVAAVTLDEVNAALRTRLPKNDLLTVVVGTAKDIRAGIEAAIPGLGATEVVRYDTEV